MRRLVIDASVWVAALDASDEFSSRSREFLESALKQRCGLELPAHAPVEIACALARRLRNPRLARDLAARLLHTPGLQVHTLTAELLERAGFLGTESLLRAADAVYAALANQLDGELVSWDTELIQRAAARTPESWLIETPS